VKPSLHLGALAASPLLLFPQSPAGWTPERPWPQASAWAGSRSCAGCHADLYRRQEVSNHARSLRPPAEIAEFNQGLPYSHHDRSSGATLTLEPGPVLKTEKDAGSQSLVLEWAFGSGKKGITPLGRAQSGGAMVESRLSWYSNGGFGVTTGAGQREPRSFAESLGRTLTEKEAQDCFGCHTTGYTPGQPAPARHEMGIRCERCHGPGAEHIRLMGSAGKPPDAAGQRRILHPGRLDAASQVSMCGVCHGRTPADTDVALLARIERDPNTVRFPSQRLVLSRCYNESTDGLACSRCHDPHTNVSALAADNDRACLACHSKPRRTCPAATRDCASCHMPSEQVMLHSRFTDHYIRVRVRGQGTKGRR